MRRSLAVVAAVSFLTCSADEMALPEPTPRALEDFAVAELHFRDRELNAIAQRLASEARLRNVDSVRAATRVEALIALEAILDAPPRALDRFNAMVRNSASTDRSAWSALRRRARHCVDGSDAVSARVQRLLEDWERHKLHVVAREVSEPRRPYLDWEAEFSDFIERTPLHAGTWAWLILTERSHHVERQFGRADAEHAYRYYLGVTRLGTDRDARIFAIPGVEIRSKRRCRSSASAPSRLRLAAPGLSPVAFENEIERQMERVSGR